MNSKLTPPPPHPDTLNDGVVKYVVPLKTLSSSFPTFSSKQKNLRTNSKRILHKGGPKSKLGKTCEPTYVSPCITRIYRKIIISEKTSSYDRTFSRKYVYLLCFRLPFFLQGREFFFPFPSVSLIVRIYSYVSRVN